MVCYFTKIFYNQYLSTFNQNRNKKILNSVHINAHTNFTSLFIFISIFSSSPQMSTGKKLLRDHPTVQNNPNLKITNA